VFKNHLLLLLSMFKTAVMLNIFVETMIKKNSGLFDVQKNSIYLR